ncbi:MAG: cyclic pyranopterin monophosphate synthase MoaC [Candidatus Cloacimonadota bacterium]|nr:MAG: cyclic pyranopterin monophosphate synthase MoaC [Candidatus Cloacimonadota bacterium]
MTSQNELSHVDKNGSVSMVDVGHKETTQRIAIASGKIFGKKETLIKIKDNQMKKGDVITTAHIAGILGAKKTSDLIPLCHPLFLDSVKLSFEILKDHVYIVATAKTSGKTGVEMEALSAVSVACLTIYDMCKAIDKEMVISDICLQEKQGGKSGHFIRE